LICLTKTHIDQSVLSKTVIETPDLDFFRDDRNMHGRGGGVIIATKVKLTPEMFPLKLITKK